MSDDTIKLGSAERETLRRAREHQARVLEIARKFIPDAGSVGLVEAHTTTMLEELRLALAHNVFLQERIEKMSAPKKAESNAGPKTKVVRKKATKKK